MNLVGRAIVMSYIGNSATLLLILTLHGIWPPLWDILGILVIVGIVGSFPAMRAIYAGRLSAVERRLLVPKVTLLFPAVMLAVHAIGWSVVHFQESKVFLPQSFAHWMAIVSAILALGGCAVYVRRLERAHKNAMPPPDPV